MTATALPASRCPRCAFRRERCVCAALPTVRLRARLVLLQHVKDARRPSNTGRLLASMAPDDVDVMPYGHPDRVLDFGALSSRPNAVALFPKDDARELTPGLFDNAVRPTLYLLDGTWSQGARLAQRLARAGCRPVKLPVGAPGAYRLRQSGDPTRVCTIEAAARALAALDEPDAAEALLAGFEIFVQAHLRQRGRG